MRTLHIAWREFTNTVLTKAFIIGVIIAPLIMIVAVPVAIVLLSQDPPPVKGTVTVIDRSGAAGEAILRKLGPEGLAAQQAAELEAVAQTAGEFAERAGADPAAIDRSTSAITAAAKSAPVPQFDATLLPQDADVEAAKKPLLTATDAPGQPMAVVVVDENAVVKGGAANDFGSFQLFVRRKLDARVQRDITDQVRRAVLDQRMQHYGVDPAQVAELTKLKPRRALSVTDQGEKSTNEAQQFLIPVAFMMLLWISVFTGGQFLMTSTIEEKSSRVMEVLLSAVSPMQIMTGKVLGQMSAGLLILVIYSGLGIVSLIVMNRGDLLEWTTIAFLVVFFFLAFFTIAALMAAVGSAVNDIHEAQVLLMPIMLVVMTPMLLMMPIISNPNGKLATVMSFTPMVSPFVMVLRLSSANPPPMWQVAVAILIGVLTVYVALRLAAKVFRVGVLMYGKPPDFTTLVRWIRMA